MRSFKHWTPRYIKDRLGVIVYEMKNPNNPWLTKTAIEVLDGLLKKTDVGLEFGSGRSTLWFAKRVKHLTSIEHNKSWYEKVRLMIVENKLRSIVDQRLFECEEIEKGQNSEYVKFIDSLRDKSVDFALVDGIYRDYCALKVIDKLHPGGILIIDNVNWFLPCDSLAPNSRTTDQGPSGKVWNRVYQSVNKWRKIWTTSGVTDTAIFFKPYD